MRNQKKKIAEAISKATSYLMEQFKKPSLPDHLRPHVFFGNVWKLDKKGSHRLANGKIFINDRINKGMLFIKPKDRRYDHKED